MQRGPQCVGLAVLDRGGLQKEEGSGAALTPCVCPCGARGWEDAEHHAGTSGTGTLSRGLQTTGVWALIKDHKATAVALPCRVAMQ